MDYLKLSKIVSLALRHTPEAYDMILDKDGWGDVDKLLINIANKHIEYSKITCVDLISAINFGNKKRHEVCGKKIRALYGHSIQTIIQKEIENPPQFLYHGTNNKHLQKIKVEGLKKMSRHYVHLAIDIDEAKKNAIRKTINPIILKINAFAAANSGINFYKEGSIWLSDFIPAVFIEVEN